MHVSILETLKPKALLVLGLLIITVSASYGQSKSRVNKNRLTGRAVMDAATFSEGPTSGVRIGTGLVNGQQVPFINKQPVQGISAILDNKDGTYYAMSDNGFGSMENSADYNLRLYKIKPAFKKNRRGEEGTMEVLGYIELKDPNNQIAFPIVNEFSADRILTGADFDIESIQRAADGTLWIGDEFGPFLLHFDADGVLIDAPYGLPDFDNPGLEIRAPLNPYNEEGATLRVMNAMRKHALTNGNAQYPVFSPWFVMMDDQNPNTKVASRETSSESLVRASSEIFDVKSLQRAGFPVVVYTVNDIPNMEGMVDLGVDGIISDRPDLLLEVVKNHDANGDGQPDFIGTDGLIDISLFDAQGHRGARNLRPENTLPSMEAALDYLMTTLETDCGITKDGIPVLDHDPYIEAAKVRKVGGAPYTEEDEVLVKRMTLAEIQNTFIADKILPGRPAQVNDRDLSPVAVAFAEAYGLVDPYVMPSLSQLFDFVNFYVEYYRSGAGSGHPEASLRWKNASQVRFNIETKLNPRTDKDSKGRTFINRTKSPRAFVDAIAGTIQAYGLQNRADIQSFDFRSLLRVHRKYPQIRTVCLFGDFPKVGESGDGTNLQDQNGENTPWLGGMYWPYRSTELSNPVRAKSSGGFEGMAITRKQDKLLTLLEKPLVDATERDLLIHEFDLETKQYTGKRYVYPLNDRGTAIGDFIMFNRYRGLVIERDGSQGDLNGFKAVYEIDLGFPGQKVAKRLAVDLLKIKDTKGISGSDQAGVVGVGRDFAFPFVTIESVVFYNRRNIGILNDNNYPFSVGRKVGAGLPDDNEFIKIRLQRPLGKGRDGFENQSEVVAEKTAKKAETIIAKEIATEVEQDVKIFPNPFEQQVQLMLSGTADKNVGYQLVDYSGKLVHQGEQKASGGKVDFDFSALNLPKGLYLLRVNPASEGVQSFWLYKK